MAATPQPSPSFSPWRKWGIGLHVGFLLLVVFSVVAMLNYLSRDYFLRFHWSTRTQYALGPRTVKFLHSLTNQVKVTVYYDRKDPLYSTLVDLLNQYRFANPRIQLQFVDYLREAGAAQKVKADYKLAGAADKNLVIFDCPGRGVQPVPGEALAQFTIEQTADPQEPYRRKLVAFAGEKAFTAALLNVTSPKPLKAYFLTGHNERPLDNGKDRNGYGQFAAVLQQNCIINEPLSLLTTNAVPMDCNLLVVAGPTTRLLDSELQKIEQYLDQGGRLLALFDAEAKDRETGLENILAKWGVSVGADVVEDKEQAPSESEVIVSAFSKHPLVNPLLGKGLYLVRPRPVSPLKARTQAADAPRVEVIAATGPRATLAGNPLVQPQRLPLMVTVEKGAVKDVATERGTTRMVVVGDSLFLSNHLLDQLANRDFADCAANWLLERTQLLADLGPRPVPTYRLVMTRAQLQSTEWILLAGMPGAVLFLGALVWLRRRR